MALRTRSGKVSTQKSNPYDVEALKKGLLAAKNEEIYALEAYLQTVVTGDYLYQTFLHALHEVDYQKLQMNSFSLKAFQLIIDGLIVNCNYGIDQYRKQYQYILYKAAILNYFSLLKWLVEEKHISPVFTYEIDGVERTLLAWVYAIHGPSYHQKLVEMKAVANNYSEMINFLQKFYDEPEKIKHFIDCMRAHLNGLPVCSSWYIFPAVNAGLKESTNSKLSVIEDCLWKEGDQVKARQELLAALNNYRAALIINKSERYLKALNEFLGLTIQDETLTLDQLKKLINKYSLTTSSLSNQLK